MAKKQPVEGKVKARVLVSGHFGSVNEVVEVDPSDVGHPDIDADPDAVAYAESLVAEYPAQ